MLCVILDVFLMMEDYREKMSVCYGRRTARMVKPQQRKKLSLISFPFSEKAKRYGPNDTSGTSDDDQ
jgi:hypothetical protein